MKEIASYLVFLFVVGFVQLQAQQPELTPIDFFDNVNNYQRIQLSNGDDRFTPSKISSYCIYKNELYVLGNFKKIDNVKCEFIAKFDGTGWKQFGDLKTLKQNFKQWNFFNTLFVFKGELLAGTYDGVKKWNGTNWVNFGLELFTVTCFCVYENKLYAGGHSGAGLMPRIAKLEGSVWKMEDFNDLIEDMDDIANMVVYNNSMYISGYEGLNKGEKRVIEPSFLEYNGSNYKQIRIDCPDDLVWKGDFNRGQCHMKVFKTIPFDKGIYAACGESSEEGGVFYWDGKSYTQLFSGKASKSIVKFNNLFIANTYNREIALIEDGAIRKWVKLPLFDVKDRYNYEWPMLIVYKNKLLFTVHE